VKLSTEAEHAAPYVNPTAAPQGRRLAPATIDAVLRALRADVPQRVIARTYGISHTSVRRIAARFLDTHVEQAVSDLSELADAERELREAGVSEEVIETIRYGHLVRRDLERKGLA
jgi:hypothetical protein